jgi:Fe-S oxidoreductase
MAPAAERAWEKVFAAVGVSLSIPSVGCCGMCGVFGYEAIHAEQSRQIFALSWQPKLEAEGVNRDTYLVSGHSCRSQIHRIDGSTHRHPVQALLERLT